MSMFLLEQIDCFHIAIQVLARVIPRVAGVVDILIRPQVREEDFPRVGFDICEGVKKVTTRVSSVQEAAGSKHTNVTSSTGIRPGGYFLP